MTETMIMGKIIGTHGHCEHFDDSAGVQFEDYDSSPQYSHIPKCEYLFIDLFTGVFMVYGRMGEVSQTGKVFE